MKSFSRAVDRFCYRHPRFGIERLMLYIVIGTAAVYIISAMDTTGMFFSYLMFSPYHIMHGEIWRLVTFAFIPSFGGLIWTAVGLYFYYFIGSTLEREWGAGRFTLYYIFGVLFYVIFGFAFYFITRMTPNLNPMYLNFSMFFAFSLLFPETRVLLFFFIPIKIKWLAWLTAALFAWRLINGDLLTVISVLNLLLFCGDYIFGRLKASRAAGAASAEFKRKMRSAQSSAQQSSVHKCAVCGRTETEYPSLDFRYCSRCAGYRCFCSDHINTHIHFTDEN